MDDKTYNEVRGFVGRVPEVSDEQFADGFLCGTLSGGVIRRKPRGDVGKAFCNVYWVGKIRQAVYLSRSARQRS